MGLLNKKSSIDPKEIAKQAAELRAQSERLEKATEEFMKGRSIKRAEQEIADELEAVNQVRESLKNDADKIKLEAAEELDKAKRTVSGAEDKLKVLDQREVDLNDREKALSEEEEALKAFKVTASQSLKSAKEMEKKYSDKLKEITRTLQALING